MRRRAVADTHVADVVFCTDRRTTEQLSCSTLQELASTYFSGWVGTAGIHRDAQLCKRSDEYAGHADCGVSRITI